MKKYTVYFHTLHCTLGDGGSRNNYEVSNATSRLDKLLGFINYFLSLISKTHAQPIMNIVC